MQEKPEQSKHESAPLFAKAQKTSIEVVREALTAELVIALCGPIGSPLHAVAERLEKKVTNLFDYEAQVIRLSAFIEEHQPDKAKPENESLYQRVTRLINSGNELRLNHGPGILSELAIHSIHMRRQESAEEDPQQQKHFRPRRVCHIIDSIKNQEELNVLRLVYRDMLFCIGVLAPIELRVEELKRREVRDPEIYQLIDKDSGEEIKHGQTVRDTFPQADFFLRVVSRDYNEIDKKLERFLQIMLGTEVVTPTSEERAMYAAATASTNSACLSRQVGAAVTDAHGNVLGTGWNDVPKVGGSLYHTGLIPDHRCINIDGGICFNDQRKDKLREEIAKALIDGNVIRREDQDKALSALNNSKIRDLLEFSRSIHAEMHAIITASQKTGDKMVGGSIYCTTYPCHSCARHIVAAGIMSVYYIEPYRKSLALELHRDAISEAETETKKVRILPFDGVAPYRFMELFRMHPDSRKRDGKKHVNSPRYAVQKSAVSLEAFPVLEAAIVRSLSNRALVKLPVNYEANNIIASAAQPGLAKA